MTQLAEACGIRSIPVLQDGRPSRTGPQGVSARYPGRPDRPPAFRWTLTPPRARARAVPGDCPAARAMRLAVAHVLYLDDGDARQRWRVYSLRARRRSVLDARRATSRDDRRGSCGRCARRNGRFRRVYLCRRRLALSDNALRSRAVAEKKLTDWLVASVAGQTSPRERTGRTEAQQEQRNADKVVDPTVVAKNALRTLP